MDLVARIVRERRRMKNNNVGAYDAAIAISVFIVFLVFKLTGVINWHWVWVVSPLWIWVAWTILQVVVIIPLIYKIVMHHAKRKAAKYERSEKTE